MPLPLFRLPPSQRREALRTFYVWLIAWATLGVAWLW